LYYIKKFRLLCIQILQFLDLFVKQNPKCKSRSLFQSRFGTDDFNYERQI